MLQGNAVHVVFVKGGLELALLGHLLAEAEQLLRALLVVDVGDVVVEEAGDALDQVLGGLILWVLGVYLGELLHERLV